MLSNTFAREQAQALGAVAVKVEEVLNGSADLPPLVLAGAVVELDKASEKLAKLAARLAAVAQPLPPPEKAPRLRKEGGPA